RRSLDRERDEAGRRLFEVLAEQDRLGLEASEAVRAYDGDRANALFVGQKAGQRAWLREKFALWLG
ncbi:MAG: hypothetical protein M3N33_00375, partial [Actinomycetota bacterium]|nr:hypothetical protein [Actinomycetota bacterium]